MLSNQRDEAIDIMRGIAMICVMLGHLDSVPEAVMQWLVPFYVPAFFFITGYLKRDKEYGRSDVLKRFNRLVVPYFGYSGLLVLGYILIHHIKGKEIIFSLRGILYSRFCLFSNVEAVDNIFFFTVANSPLWFLTALFVAEVIYMLLSKITKRVGYGCVCFLLVAIGYAVTYFRILLPWSIDTAMIGTVFMIAGNCYKRVPSKKSSYFWLLFLYILVVCVNPQANMSVRYYGPWNLSILLFVAGGISGSILMKYACELLTECRAIGGGINKVLCAIGKNSLPILALHWFLFQFIDILIEKLNITILWNVGYGLLKICFAIMMCLCFEYIVCRLFKRKVS